MIDTAPHITPEQMEDARSLLHWSRERLAVMSETTAAFIRTYEDSGRVMKMVSRGPSIDGLAAIRTALEAAGIEFTNGDQPDVRLARVVG